MCLTERGRDDCTRKAGITLEGLAGTKCTRRKQKRCCRPSQHPFMQLQKRASCTRHVVDVWTYVCIGCVLSKVLVLLQAVHCSSYLVRILLTKSDLS